MSRRPDAGGRADGAASALTTLTVRELLAELAALEAMAATGPEAADAERSIREELDRRRLSWASGQAHPVGDDADLLEQAMPGVVELDDDQYPRASSAAESPG